MTKRMLRNRGWMLAGLLQLGVNAVAAGYGFIGTPDGSALGIPIEWLEDSPFRDYRIPGFLLASMGLLSLLAAFMQLRRREHAWAWAAVTGAGFVLWIIVQATMMGSFRHPVQTALQAIVLNLGLFILLLAFIQYRDWHLHWGATDAEFNAAMPGDDHISNPAFNPTRAITIDAPPEAVWPWLVQIGYGRAGFYSYDRLDNSGRPSLDHVDPKLQSLKVSDWIPMSRTITEDTAFRVALLDPPHTMVWTKPDSSWAWSLRPLPGSPRRTLARRIVTGLFGLTVPSEACSSIKGGSEDTNSSALDLRWARGSSFTRDEAFAGMSCMGMHRPGHPNCFVLCNNLRRVGAAGYLTLKLVKRWDHAICSQRCRVSFHRREVV